MPDAKPLPPGLDPARTFKPGQSGNPNPGGRPNGWKGASRFIKEKFGDDCRLLISAVARLALSPDTPPSVKLQAFIELLNRGIGKPPTEVMLSIERPTAALDLRRLSDEELADFERLCAKCVRDDDDAEPALTEPESKPKETEPS